MGRGNGCCLQYGFLPFCGCAIPWRNKNGHKRYRLCQIFLICPRKCAL